MKCRQRQQTQLLETELLLKLLLLLLLQLELGGEVVELGLLLAGHGRHEETLVLSRHQRSLHWVELGQLLSLKLLHLELLQLLGSCKLCLQQLVVMWLWNKLLWWRRKLVVMGGWRRRWL